MYACMYERKRAVVSAAHDNTTITRGWKRQSPPGITCSICDGQTFNLWQNFYQKLEIYVELVQITLGIHKSVGVSRDRPSEPIILFKP